jgi:3-oxoacyl-[acyl-carrier protein] reductase
LAELTLVSAALGVDANLDQVTEEIYTTHFDTNVKAPIFLTQAVVPHIPQGGRIVFVSSAAARLGVAGQTVYGATKAANESLARVWAKELGQSHGITVNCVNPDPVATGTYVRSVLPCP